MLTDICEELHNYFCGDEDKHLGVFTISDGKLTPSDFLLSGQYFRIVGSVFNDGVYCNSGNIPLKDETFGGAVWVMRLPIAFIDLVDDINKYEEKYGEVAKSPYTSESFGGYSYTKAEKASWKSVFAHRLKRWRKI